MTGHDFRFRDRQLYFLFSAYLPRRIKISKKAAANIIHGLLNTHINSI